MSNAMSRWRLAENQFGPEHLSLKVPNIEFEFDVSAHPLTSNAVTSKNLTSTYNGMQMSNSMKYLDVLFAWLQ